MKPDAQRRPHPAPLPPEKREDSNRAAPPWIQPRGTDVCLSIKVQPRASRNEIGDALGGELKIKVTAPPVDAAANEALVRFLAETLDCPKSAVQLLRGHTSRHKQILVQGMSVQIAMSKLGSK